MNLTTKTSISDSDLVDLNNNIQNAAINLKFACLSLRSCYTVHASSIKEFTDLRGEITNHAKLYSLKILPFATLVIQQLQDFIESYTVLTFDEFRDDIVDLAADACKQRNVTLYTKHLHMEILAGFKSSQDKASVVLKKLEKDAQWYQENANQLRKASDKFYWAIALAFIPYVNVIAIPFLTLYNIGAIKAISNDEESKLAVLTTAIIKDVLAVAIKNFVDALTNITGFFSILESELTLLTNGLDDKPKRMHYNKCKARATIIANSCRAYIGSIPDCQTDLQVIPDDFDKNYVQQWLAEKKAEICVVPQLAHLYPDGIESISLLEWGNHLFEANKKALAMLISDTLNLNK